MIMKQHGNNYSLILIFCLFSQLEIACSSNEKKTDFKNHSIEDIVLELKNSGNNLKKYVNPPSGPHSLSGIYDFAYLDNMQKMNKINIEDSKILNIGTGKQHVNLEFSYQVLDQIGFLLSEGDSVEVEFIDNFPFLKIKNRIMNKLELNFERFVFEYLNLNGNSASGYLNSGYFLLLTVTGNKGGSNYDSLVKVSDYESHVYLYLLDSLKKKEIISDRYYTFYSSRRRLLDLSLMSENRYDKDLIRDFFLLFDDELIDYLYYQSALEVFLNRYSKIKGIKMVETSNTSDFDSRQLFDLMEKEIRIPPLTHENLMKRIMERIVRSFPTDDIKIYLKRYLEISKDSSSYDLMIVKYNLDFTKSFELQLSGEDSSVTNFESFLRRQKGKLVYVDFWASWCAPCIRSIPDSKRLAEDFSDHVSFVYLSIDEDRALWQRATEKYGLNDFNNNFLILNAKTSEMLRSIELGSIPRYLIYDNNGILVHQNAPDPGSEEIRNLFRKIAIQ